MWTYEVSTNWTEEKKGKIRCAGKQDVAISTPPEFGGPEGFWTPEDLLTSAVETCILTSTLFFAERAKIELRSYSSQATGTMEKTAEGIRFTKIVVEINIVLEVPEQELAMRHAIEQAKKTCPISNSLACPIELTLQIA